MNVTAAPDVTGLLARAQVRSRRAASRGAPLRRDGGVSAAELRRAAELGLTCFDLRSRSGVAESSG